MPKVVVVKDKRGDVVDRISPHAVNLHERIQDAVRRCGEGGVTITEEEDPNFVDFLGMKKP